ncbi:hypothetical protein ABIF65_006545 [Bradyrhizobium japonicum]|uniref:hypothetical protein n=1 Tax=Bradyrhizobium TaxID=374 RepID=UPI0012BD6E8B|nr:MULTISPECIES: hypothetical protein [Bradyrhizobium]MBR0880882.1 hypothetical protein [Bradyrhizobium liaoningense]MBR0947259.1 hypothetical protein [Bradyrhizobium liaoningense]MBR1001844.1 hypothetical protein [Bradyrhizobium liaoningense]MBR1032620.1 hypothetical protein [Bradyrhizobium liaoningense]MBR1068174.1 hypothetical protein [Bradyrhizobium liaoningense]
MRATIILNLPVVSPRWVDFDRSFRMKYHLPRPQTSRSSCRHGRLPGLISIELNTDAADHHQNANEAERDLHRKLIGDAEQLDVAGKRQQDVALSISTVIRRI